MKPINHILFWIALFVIQFFAVLFIFEPADIYKSIEKEEVMIQQMIGSSHEKLKDDGNNYFEKYIVEKGLIEISHLASNETKVGGTIQSIVETFWASVYQLTQRFMVILYWIKYLFVLFIPAIIDGLVKRRVMLYEAGWSSPVRYHAAIHSVIAMTALPVVYLNFPTAIHPLIVPVWLVMSALSISALISNFQKRI